jgi:hypothetical protein
MLLSHFSMGQPRNTYSLADAKPSRADSVRRVHLLVVQMQRADVNAPGGQLEH